MLHPPFDAAIGHLHFSLHYNSLNQGLLSLYLVGSLRPVKNSGQVLLRVYAKLLSPEALIIAQNAPQNVWPKKIRVLPARAAKK